MIFPVVARCCVLVIQFRVQAGKDAGLMINFHGDELNPMASGELGAELGAKAISHLEHVSGDVCVRPLLRNRD